MEIFTISLETNYAYEINDLEYDRVFLAKYDRSMNRVVEYVHLSPNKENEHDRSRYLVHGKDGDAVFFNFRRSIL